MRMPIQFIVLLLDWKGLLWRSALVYLLNMPLLAIITALMVAAAHWRYG